MPLVSIREATERLQCDNRTLRRWIERGTVKAVHNVNGRLAIEESEVARVAELLRGREQQPTKQPLEDRVRVLEEEVKRLSKLIEATEPPAITPTPAPRAEQQAKPVKKQPAALPEEKPRVSDVAQHRIVDIPTPGWKY